MSWTRESIEKVYNQPLMELVYKAATVHRQHHNPLEVQVSTLLSIKTGGCSEDCGYCPQAARYHTGVDNDGLMSVELVRSQAENAKKGGSSRLCMGAAWRNVKDGPEFEKVLDMVRTVNEIGMEVCCTLGMITETQAKRLEEAGLHSYNHNLDSSEEYYKEVISTRDYHDRLDTIGNVRKTGINVCSGGIIGMGEKIEDRIGMLLTYAEMEEPPESIPINALVAVDGTPMEGQEPVSIWDMVRMIATTRIVFPTTQVRLSAGRTSMNKEGQALCFMAGASSIFAGDKLLTTPNPDVNEDMQLFEVLGIKPKEPFVDKEQPVSLSKEEMTPAQGEKPRWTRPGHTIDRNIQKSKIGR